MSLSEPRELVMDREAWRTAIYGATKSGTRLSDWTELNWTDTVSKNKSGADSGSDDELLIAKFRLKLKKVGKQLEHSGMTEIKSPTWYSESEKKI